MPRFETVLRHEVRPERYSAAATIVGCIDSRFRPAYRGLEDHLGLTNKHVDRIRVAGGARDLTRRVRGLHSHALMDNLAVSLKAHRPERVILTVHAGCGYYQEHEQFESHEAERFALGRDLEHGIDLVSRSFMIAVEAYLLDFGGVHRYYP